jgi:hypothetical protein
MKVGRWEADVERAQATWQAFRRTGRVAFFGTSLA